jgi:hypothetical protein
LKDEAAEFRKVGDEPSLGETAVGGGGRRWGAKGTERVRRDRGRKDEEVVVVVVEGGRGGSVGKATGVGGREISLARGEGARIEAEAEDEAREERGKT